MTNFLDQKCQVTVTKVRTSVSRKKYAWLVIERNEGIRLIKQLEKMCQHKEKIDIIVVDGGSTDGTTETLARGDIGITDLLVSGAGAGFSTDLQIGLLYVAEKGYSGAITSDGNGKDSVQDIEKFMKLLDEGVDFIQGSRFLQRGNHSNTPLLRYIGIRFVSSPYTSFIAKIRITDSTNGFRGYSRKLILDERLNLKMRFYRGYSLVSYIPFLIGKYRLNFAEASVRRDYPDSGATPTKIVSVTQWLQIFFDLFRGTFESYPERKEREWLKFKES